MSTSKRGFGSMDKDKLRQLSIKAGRRAHDLGRAHVWTAEEAREAGRKSAARRAAQRVSREESS